MPAQLPPQATITRFIYDREKIRGDGRPHGRAFLPSLEQGRFETSICHRDGLQEDEIWARAALRKDKAVKGRADLTVAGVNAVHGACLRCEEAPDEGFPEHAVIVNWPQTKPDQLVLANLLAEISGKAVIAPS